MDSFTTSITLGYGEYVAFHDPRNNERKTLSRETFEQVYKIFNENSLGVMGVQVNLYELIKEKVKKIDPTLEIAFIPRTLYELIFIRKCILEDLKYGICSQLNPMEHKKSLEHFDGDEKKYEIFLSNQVTKRRKRKCWHLSYFEDAGDNNHPGVKEVAYRLNQLIVKMMVPKGAGFTMNQILLHTEVEIGFLKDYNKEGLLGKNLPYTTFTSNQTPGPATNFLVNKNYINIKAMGICNEKMAQIMINAVKLECSEAARNSFILYRGSEFMRDEVLRGKDVVYSLSFGTGLFSGCVFDGGASPYHYMRKSDIDAFAILIPSDQLNSSPFYIPTTNAGCSAIW